jgi:transcriptional regulator with XRE-family HTH domain
MNKKNPLKGLGQRMKYIREKRGASITDVAYHIGCADEALEAIESGSMEQGQTYVAQLMRWADYFGVDLEVLLRGSEGHFSQFEELFAVALLDAEHDALHRLASIDPTITLIEGMSVRRMIEEKFNTFRAERARNVLAWRRDERFAIDDFELRHMLKIARSPR